MSDEPAEPIRPILPFPVGDDAPSEQAEPSTNPDLNLQGDNYRSMSYQARKNAPPFQWKPFLLWMAFGLCALWSFVLLIVFLAFQVLDANGSGSALGAAAALALVSVFIGRAALRNR